MKLAQCVILALMVGVGISRVSAQLPDIPQPSSDSLRIAGLTLEEREIAGWAASNVEPATASFGTGAVVRTVPAAAPRVADFKFYTANGFHLGMAVLDVEMTQRCIAAHRCREANPMMPSSQSGQLSVDFALVALTSVASYRLKKSHTKLWWLPPAAGAGIHGIGALTGLEH